MSLVKGIVPGRNQYLLWLLKDISGESMKMCNLVKHVELERRDVFSQLFI